MKDLMQASFPLMWNVLLHFEPSSFSVILMFWWMNCFFSTLLKLFKYLLIYVTSSISKWSLQFFLQQDGNPSFLSSSMSITVFFIISLFLFKITVVSVLFSWFSSNTSLSSSLLQLKTSLLSRRFRCFVGSMHLSLSCKIALKTLSMISRTSHFFDQSVT